MLEITAGGFSLSARFEEGAAPATAAAFRRLLPLIGDLFVPSIRGRILLGVQSLANRVGPAVNDLQDRSHKNHAPEQGHSRQAD